MSSIVEIKAYYVRLLVFFYITQFTRKNISLGNAIVIVSFYDILLPIFFLACVECQQDHPRIVVISNIFSISNIYLY